MTDQQRTFPAPLPTIETQEFWDGIDADQLLLKTCNSCGKAHYYPRAICPLCGSDDTHFVAASGRGTLYSFSILRRPAPPYAVAYIRLDEGPLMLSNIVDCDLDALEIGQTVTVRFVKTEGDGPQVPVFTPLGTK